MFELDPTIITLATVPAIVALTNLIKGLGVHGKWSALIAVLLGVGLTAGGQYVEAELWNTISEGLILGLGAAGLYDVATPSTVARTTVFSENVGTVAAPLNEQRPAGNVLVSNPPEVTER